MEELFFSEKQRIFIGDDSLTDILGLIASIQNVSSFFLVTDRNVEKHWLEKFNCCFHDLIPHGVLHSFVIEGGEESKSRRSKEQIENEMLKASCDRDCCMIAFGGGVIGDLTGFVASTFMRGVRYVNIPTSLLAMVDASIGGKTAVNTCFGKNLIGSFWPALMILINLKFLVTLDERNFCNGLAEVVKIAFVFDRSFFSKLEKIANTDMLRNNRDVLLEIISQSATLKAKITSDDFYESGKRNFLNWGHTFGHALEHSSNLLHGEAVSIGMVKEAELSRRLGLLSNNLVQRLIVCLQSFSLPVDFPTNYDRQLITEFIGADKKNRCGMHNFVLVKSNGDAELRPISKELYETMFSPSYSISTILSNISDKDVDVHISVPGSKSMSNRALILVALSNSSCSLGNLTMSEDTNVMMLAFQKLKLCDFQWIDSGERLLVNPKAGEFNIDCCEIDVQNSGTAARFLTTLACFNRNLNGRIVIRGCKRMHERPISDLVDSLLSNGAKIDYLETTGFLPIQIMGGNIPKGDRITIEGSKSSQFISSLLLCSPLFPNDLHLTISGTINSKSFILMTLEMMKSFGKNYSFIQNEITVSNGLFDNPSYYNIESDASAAAFPFSYAALKGITVTVENLSFDSLQGDIKYVKVLEQMGCLVYANGTGISVRGPKNGSLKGLNVDMNSMSDCFLVLSAIACYAVGVTRITGISTQRLKECNRISAMISELTKIGAKVKELSDGLEITGNSPNLRCSKDIVIKTHKDHRIAMSLAIISNNKIIIDDPYCVCKTWPSFWDDMIQHFDFKIMPNFKHVFLQELKFEFKIFLLIGMRNSGKSDLGRCAARHLGIKFIDMDNYFELTFGSSINSFVECHGWDRFRTEEFRLLEKVLLAVDQSVIIATGGGIVETSEARDLLLHNNIEVIQIINENLSYEDYSKPAYPNRETFSQVYERRKTHYKECSKYDFYVFDYNQSSRLEFCHFVKRLLEKDLVDCRYFLSIGSNVAELKNWDNLTLGVDAIELRIDLLKEENGKLSSYSFVARNVSLIRQNSNLPIIFTVRSLSNGGNFPNNEDIVVEYLILGLRLNVDFLDIETWISDSAYQKVCSMKGNCLIVSSFHDFESKLSFKELKNYLREVIQRRNPKIMKIVSKAKSEIDNLGFISTLQTLKDKFSYIKFSGLLMGKEGKITRIINEFFNPVTHESLCPTAAGQISLTDLIHFKLSLSLLQPKKFFLFGSPIGKSPSAVFHNTGFKVLGLPFFYEKVETGSIVEVVKCLKFEGFGGCSITMPLKEQLFGNLDLISDEARKIGAVNTIITTDSGLLFGENTDWKGLKSCLNTVVSQSDVVFHETSVIIIGAGGTSRAACFALQTLGIKNIYLFNRSADKGKHLCDEFGINLVNDLDNSHFEILISTIPPENTSFIPDFLIENCSILCDFAYLIEMKTNLVLRALKQNKRVIDGLDILIEQGYCQFSLFTGFKPPKSEMKEAVLEFCRQSE